jgi:glucokinase
VPTTQQVGSVLALDLGGTQLRAAVVRPTGELVGRRSAPTPREGARAVVERCAATLAEARTDPAASSSPVDVLVISAPGPLDPDRGVLIDPPNLPSSLHGFALADALAERTGLPCRLERDTQLAALAEGRFGAARGLTDYVYLTVSTGVGGAIVSDGRLLRGPDGAAGELGHLLVDLDGPRCGCGARGHLEALASGTGIAAAAREAAAQGEVDADSPLGQWLADHEPSELDARRVALAEEAGDPVAARIMSRARDAFAAALVAIVDVFNPECVIVGGGVAIGQGERLLQPARERIAAEAFRAQAARATLVPAALGDDVGLLGAIALVGQTI